MEALERLRTAVQGVLNEKVGEIQAQFEGERNSRNAAIEEERTSYRKNLDDFEKKLADLDQIKAENERLKDEINGHNERTKAQSATVSLADFQKVKSQLEICKVDYSRVLTARNILDTKCRHYKELLKEWKDYSREYLRRNAEVHHGQDSRYEKQGSFLTNAMDVGLSIDPPPPSYAGTLSFSSNLSRPISPFSKSSSRPRSRSPRAHPDTLATPRANSKHDIRPNVEDLVDTSDGSDVRVGAVDEHGKSPNVTPLRPSPPHNEVETGGSSPVVVFERSLKRKNPNQPGGNHIRIHEDFSVEKERKGHHRVKPEKGQLSSSPLQPSRLINQQGYTGESLDLDEVEGTLYTPRKRRRLGRTRVRSLKFASSDFDPVAEHGELMDEGDPLGLQELRSAVHCNAALNNDENHELLFNESVEGEAHHKNFPKEGRSNQLHADYAGLQAESAARRPKSSSSPSSRDTELRASKSLHDDDVGQKDVHHSLDISNKNRRSILPRTSAERTRKPRQCPPSRRDRGAVHVPALAEDGERPTPPNLPTPSIDRAKSRTLSTPINTTKRAAEAPNPYGRLNTLLNDNSWSKASSVTSNRQRSLSSALGVPTLSKLFEQTDATVLTTPQSLKASKRTKASMPGKSKSALQPSTTRANLITYSKKRASGGDGPSDIMPEHEPLRARPLHRLRLEDFKLNPNHSNYAYHEIIRKHDEKKTLSGCTDPFCQRCKDLKKFAEMSGYSATNKAGLFDCSPTMGVEESDDRLLSEFLGGDAYRIPMMSAKEKKEMLVKARTKQFNDRFGKHRQTFSKPPEPPGFWMVDFPSTQENEQFAEEARAIERTKIEERREEAVRRGAWLFADEV